MISQILKAETKELHDLVEKKFKSHKIFEGVFTREDYRRLLRFNYLFLLNYEEPVFSSISQRNAEAMNLDLRRKLPLFNKETEQVLCSDDDLLPVLIKNEAEAFGILYVMEGATLGGTMIAKKLGKDPAFARSEFRYFRCYGEHTGSMWKSFKSVMDEAITEENHADCLQGAQKAYHFLLSLNG